MNQSLRHDTTSIRALPVAGALGAELEGVDLTRLDEAQFDAIHAALLEHCVVFLHDQDITPAEQLAFARRFGEIHFHPYIQSLDAHPEIVEVIKTETDTYNFGGGWHTDQMFAEHPASITMLYAREVPGAGGDTLFANMYAAYDALSDGMRKLAGSLETVNQGDSSRHRTGMSRAQRYQRAKGIKLREDAPDEPEEVLHPLVRTHPETGQKSLYVNALFTTHIVGLTPLESQALLGFLYDHIVSSEFTVRLKWEPKTIALWDNRSTQHKPENDFFPQHRLMHRVTVSGDRPA